MKMKDVCAAMIGTTTDEAKAATQAQAVMFVQTGTVEMATIQEVGDVVAHQEILIVQGVTIEMIVTDVAVMTVTGATTVITETDETTAIATAIVMAAVNATMTATGKEAEDVMKSVATLQALPDLGHLKPPKTNATVVQFSSNSSPHVYVPKISLLSLRRLGLSKRHRLSRTELVDVQRGKSYLSIQLGHLTNIS